MGRKRKRTARRIFFGGHGPPMAGAPTFFCIIRLLQNLELTHPTNIRIGDAIRRGESSYSPLGEPLGSPLQLIYKSLASHPKICLSILCGPFF